MPAAWRMGLVWNCWLLPRLRGGEEYLWWQCGAPPHFSLSDLTSLLFMSQSQCISLVFSLVPSKTSCIVSVLQISHNLKSEYQWRSDFLLIFIFPDLLLCLPVFVYAFGCPGGCSLGSAALHWVCQEISWTPQWSGLIKTLFTQGDLFKVTERHKVLI